MMKCANPGDLADANRNRSREACERDVARAGAALRWLGHQPEPDDDDELAIVRRYRTALRMRENWPTDTLAQIAARYGMTKDAYSTRLRRAFRYAERGMAA